MAYLPPEHGEECRPRIALVRYEAPESGAPTRAKAPARPALGREAFVGDKPGQLQLLSCRGQLQRIQFELPPKGRLGVVAQALGVTDGDQEQVESPGPMVAGSQIVVTNQPVVHPAKTAGDLTQPIRSEETFDDHNQNRVFHDVALEAPAPECCNPVLSVGGRSLECHLVTYCP
jgi:hypothetical protein